MMIKMINFCLAEKEIEIKFEKKKTQVKIMIKLKKNAAAATDARGRDGKREAERPCDDHCDGD